MQGARKTDRCRCRAGVREGLVDQVLCKQRSELGEAGSCADMGEAQLERGNSKVHVKEREGMWLEGREQGAEYWQ